LLQAQGLQSLGLRELVQFAAVVAISKTARPTTAVLLVSSVSATVFVKSPARFIFID
jgi:hypothetical protein